MPKAGMRAHAGWAPRWTSGGHRGSGTALRAAYDKGFADGGGDAQDLFDEARRAFIAAARAVPASAASEVAPSLPSTWPKPSDAQRPCSWHRRAIILSEADQHCIDRKGRHGRSTVEIVQERSSRLATILVVGAAGIAINPHAPRAPAPPLTTAEADALIRDPVQSAVLRSAFVGREIDDILVAVQGEPLRVLDALVGALPIGRTRERTRNSALQQRAHLETWLARGVMPGENLGAGHIRWSKRALGLTGKLGEFVVRYAGRHPAGGHLLRVSLIDASIDPTVGASPAEGFVTSGNVRLSPHVRFSNKANMRREMALALRAFGSATRLAAPEPAGRIAATLGD